MFDTANTAKLVTTIVMLSIFTQFITDRIKDVMPSAWLEKMNTSATLNSGFIALAVGIL